MSKHYNIRLHVIRRARPDLAQLASTFLALAASIKLDDELESPDAFDPNSVPPSDGKEAA